MRFIPILFCLAIAAYTQQTSDGPAGGGKDQKGKKVQADDTAKDDSEALLTSPDSKEAAVYRCASTDQPKEEPPKKVTVPCPLTEELGKLIAKRFNQPLKTGKNEDSELAKAVKTLLKAQHGGEPVTPLDVPWVIVHLVDRQGPVGQARQARGEAVKKDADGDLPVRQRWLLAKRVNEEFLLSESKRIMGSRRIGVVFIHVNAVVDADEPPEDKYGAVTYRAFIEKKLPANVQNLFSLIKLAGSFQAAAKSAIVSYFGHGVLLGVDVPSNVTIFGVDVAAASSVKMIGSATEYDNEGKYFWDVSVGVPVNKLSLVEYAEEGRTYIPKQINKQSVYGLINLYPIPVDIKSGNLRWVLPRVVGGLGFTGRPGENFFVGGAWGVPQLQFFLGSGFANHRVLLPGRDAGDPTAYVQKYGSRLTYGINVPVLSAIKKLTSKEKK